MPSNLDVHGPHDAHHGDGVHHGDAHHDGDVHHDHGHGICALPKMGRHLSMFLQPCHPPPQVYDPRYFAPFPQYQFHRNPDSPTDQLPGAAPGPKRPVVSRPDNYSSLIESFGKINGYALTHGANYQQCESCAEKFIRPSVCGC